MVAGLVVCGFWVGVAFGWCLCAFLPTVVAIVYVVLVSILFGGCKWLYFAFVGVRWVGGLRGCLGLICLLGGFAVLDCVWGWCYLVLGFGGVLAECGFGWWVWLRWEVVAGLCCGWVWFVVVFGCLEVFVCLEALFGGRVW